MGADLKTHRRLLAAALVVVVALGACGGDEESTAASTSAASTTAASPAPTTAGEPLPEPVQALDVDGRDYSFEISPDTSGGLSPGWTLVRFRNVGAEAHQVMFARIKDGVDMSELAEAGAGDSSGAGAIEFVDMIGGVSYIDPDQTTTALVNLDEGLVMAMCYVPDAAGTAHALMGMTSTLNVSADADEPAPLDAPLDAEVQGTIAMTADGYDLPEELRAGWYHVTNTDDALHELSLLRLSSSIDDDETQALVEDLAANRPPEIDLDAKGGMGAISPGFDGYLYLDLDPGSYLAVDFMPDPGEPRPHMLDGYYETFTV